MLHPNARHGDEQPRYVGLSSHAEWARATGPKRKLQHLLIQLRRYGHTVGQQERNHNPPRHFATTTDNRNNMTGQSENFNVPPGNVSSPLYVGGGTSGSASAVHVATNASLPETQLFEDDSDTSDDESEYDYHPDPHPTDPDMTGWSSNQIGCFLPNIQTLQENGATSRVLDDNRADDLHDHELEQDA